VIAQNSRGATLFLTVLAVFVLLGVDVRLTQAMPLVQRSILPNGLVLLVSEEHSLPFATFQLLIDAGSRNDPPDQDGLANLTARGVLLETAEHTASRINEQFDFMGASLDVSTEREFVVLNLRVLTRYLDKGFDLFLEAITEPAFPGEEIQREIRTIQAAIQSAEERPEVVARKAFEKELYLNPAYAHPVEGTAHSLSRLTREDVLRFYQTWYHPDNAILAVVGDISETMQAKLIAHLAKWPKGAIPEKHFPTGFAQGPKVVKINRDLAQANIILGHEGIARSNPDYYALSVMNYILGGGGFGTWLMEEIRVKRGLAYSVASFFDAGKYPGSFQVVLQTKNASAREAISLVLEQMEKMKRELISEQELEKAKKYLTGNFPLRLDTQEKLVSFITRIEYYGLGLDYFQRYSALIGSVSREDVNHVAKTYLHPEDYILVVVANLKEAGMSEAGER